MRPKVITATATAALTAALVLIGTAASAGVSQPPAVPGPLDAPNRPQGVARYAGADRISTSVMASQLIFGRTDHIIVASAETYADSIAGARLAAHLDASLLLTPARVLDDRVAAEIKRIANEDATIIVLGGESAVSADVMTALAELDPVGAPSG